MKRAIIFLLVGAVLSLAAALAQEAPPQVPKAGEAKTASAPPAPKYPIEAWKPFVSRVGNFSVLFPIIPKEEMTRARLQAGLAEDHRYTVPTGDGNYQAAYTFLSDNLATPEAIRTRFDSLLKTLKANPTLKWISGGENEYEGNPGIEFKTQFNDSKVILWSRQYFAYGCVYEITTRYLSHEPEMKEPKMFMDSFKLLGPPLNRPLNLGAMQDALPDFTPLAQGLYYISEEKLRAQAIEKPDPKFDTQGKPFSGTITLLVTVSPEGKVTQAELSDGFPGFYNEAIKAAKKWTFKPFLLNGKPVRVQGRLAFKFGITDLQKAK